MKVVGKLKKLVYRRLIYAGKEALLDFQGMVSNASVAQFEIKAIKRGKVPEIITPPSLLLLSFLPFPPSLEKRWLSFALVSTSIEDKLTG